jgi:hypothetical protein
VQHTRQQNNESILQQLETDGFSYLDNFCEPALTTQLLSVSREITADIKRTLGKRQIGVGSRAGYREIVQRSPGRWDVPITPEQFSVDHTRMPWWPLITAVLGENAEHAFSGVVTSEPGSDEQFWHIDSPHETVEHASAHAINLFVALTDIPMLMGPTEFACGSHRLTNHLFNPALAVDQLLYQHTNTSPAMLKTAPEQATPVRHSSAVSAGSCLIFDDRIMHRGLANQTSKTRHLAYFSYKRQGYLPYTHFESTRSLFKS